MNRMMSRRGFLASTALTGGLATLAAARGAAAFTTTKGSVEAQQLYLQRCNATDGSMNQSKKLSRCAMSQYP